MPGNDTEGALAEMVLKRNGFSGEHELTDPSELS